jgi:hypothetical protein
VSKPRACHAAKSARRTGDEKLSKHRVFAPLSGLLSGCSLTSDGCSG